jgi:hypothetical protein
MGCSKNEETRSNVALVNIGQLGPVREVYSIDLSAEPEVSMATTYLTETLV